MFYILDLIIGEYLINTHDPSVKKFLFLTPHVDIKYHLIILYTEMVIYMNKISVDMNNYKIHINDLVSENESGQGFRDIRGISKILT